MFENVDCLRFYIENLEDGIEYYHKKLGLKIAWRMEHAIGFLMNDNKTEIVIQNFDKRVETDTKVKSVIDAVKKVLESGGKVISGPFDIEIGKCAIIEDPWGNKMTILDTTKGLFVTDTSGNIIGQKEDK